MKRMDGAAVATEQNVYPIVRPQAMVEETDEQQLSFVDARLMDLRAKTMAPPTKPYWNTTMVTAWVAVIVGMITILSAIGGLWYFTDQRAEQRGIEMGRQQAEREQMQRQLDKQANELKILEEKLKAARGE